ITELYGTSEAPYLDIYAKVAASGNSITFESTFEPMGKTFKIAVFSPGIGKFATLFADITERKRMEDVLKNSHAMLEHRVAERTEELEKTNRELSDANAKLREVDVMKSEFLDTVSHELRTPLTSIIGYSGLLLDGIQGDMNEKQTQYVGGIWRKGMHQLQLVNDILDLSKLESRSMSVNLESVSVSKTIEDVMKDIMPLVNDKQHEIFVEIAEGVGDVCADRIRLKQVLLNLISNAIKFTSDNGKIIVKANNEKEMVRISVIDNGMGIKQDDMGKLFNRFIQIDQSNTRHVGGTGLGLAIVKDLMKLMGGSVELKSEFGNGSTFSILLPEAQSLDASNE
ncbi:MAG: HAMP domain-containing histidine kinase, partial [Methanosarcinales archaeon]|nr:HAMP domain-containing histidine kinase [Methanosarcinales archaeon]